MNQETIENLIKAERLYATADILLAYQKYIDFHGLADKDEFLSSLRKQRLHNGSVILKARQSLDLDTGMFSNEEVGITND